MATVEETDVLIFEKDVEIGMRDGVVLRANVFRPRKPGRYPVVMAMGVYGKDAHFKDAFAPQWKVLKSIYPGLDTEGSSGRFLRWEMVDPERWVPDGFVVVAVDSRGSGKSPGHLDPFSPVETMDYYELIEWGGTREWSNGKVGLIGISYYAIKQWQVAALNPPHLAAIIPWEGASDFYRDIARHGGILSNGFIEAWMPRQVLVNQHGNAATTLRDPDTGEPTTGPGLSEDMLKGNIADFVGDLHAHRLDDQWIAARVGSLDAITVPVYSAGNLGGPGMHLRGNVEGFLGVASEYKWLQLHVGTHYESFYLPEFVVLQKRFFERFLRGGEPGLFDQAPVRVALRRPDGAEWLEADRWPLRQTDWTSFHLAPDGVLDGGKAADGGALSFEAMGEGVSFSTPPFTEEVSFAGPAALKIAAASSTTDMDIFASLHLIDPEGEEVRFIGAHEETPVARGWLRASHRALDPEHSTPYRPYHRHTAIEKLSPGTVYPLDVEIWPTSIVCPPGYRLRLCLRGNDFKYDGTGRLLHDSSIDRPEGEFSGTTTLHFGAGHEACLLLPKI